MSGPVEVADTLGWGTIFSISSALALALLGYGASTQRSKTTEAAVDELKKEHGSAIKEAKAAADQVARDLIASEKSARERFVLTTDLDRVERTLSEKIGSSKDETKQKIEELKVEFGRKGIEHVVRNAITSGMAQVLLETKRKDER